MSKQAQMKRISASLIYLSSQKRKSIRRHFIWLCTCHGPLHQQTEGCEWVKQLSVIFRRCSSSCICCEHREWMETVAQPLARCISQIRRITSNVLAVSSQATVTNSLSLAPRYVVFRNYNNRYMTCHTKLQTPHLRRYRFCHFRGLHSLQVGTRMMFISSIWKRKKGIQIKRTGPIRSPGQTKESHENVLHGDELRFKSRRCLPVSWAESWRFRTAGLLVSLWVNFLCKIWGYHSGELSMLVFWCSRSRHLPRSPDGGKKQEEQNR